MLRSFTLKNFRCFQNLNLEPLERVNLIAGKNNVGKTSLLEAIFIYINPTNPESPLQVNSLRGIGRGRFEDIEEMRGFFFDQDIDKAIELSSKNENNDRSSLKICLAGSEESQLSLSDDDSATFKANESLTTEVRSYDKLVLEYQDNTRQTNTSRIGWTSPGKLLGRSRREKFPLGIYLTTSTRSPREDAERFSNLERVGRQDEVLQTLRLLEPRLQRLTLLVMEHRPQPIIYGDIGMSELVPLPLMGEGIGRLLSIILAIANAKGGTILIDEIENGLHYSVMTEVWKAIADAARRADTQIFATTHSLECIKAAHETFDSSEKYDFRYHRLERVNDEIRAFTYDRETLATSDEMNLEMR
ncbi:AAA family ATPase [Microcoleus sp. ZQ-A2]|nr:AAA family ATPase [Microcoleus sp. FACHB-1]